VNACHAPLSLADHLSQGTIVPAAQDIDQLIPSDDVNWVLIVEKDVKRFLFAWLSFNSSGIGSVPDIVQIRDHKPRTNARTWDLTHC
jgi:hypothetical protein